MAFARRNCAMIRAVWKGGSRCNCMPARIATFRSRTWRVWKRRSEIRKSRKFERKLNMTLFRLGVPIVALAAASHVLAAADANSSSKGVQITTLDDRLHIEINGQLFTEYFFKD